MKKIIKIKNMLNKQKFLVIAFAVLVLVIPVIILACVAPPTVDIKANSSDGPITIAYNTSATLSWTSSNATSCYASGGWSGSKSISGSESTGNLTSSKTYTITCTGSGGSVSDSVTVNVEASTLSASLTVLPASGCAPLNGVDLKANVSGTATGTINYKFDCTNDGTWDLEINGSTNNPYTATNLCNYALVGNYTAKVKVERGTATPSENTASVGVTDCSPNSPTVDIKANSSDGPITIAYNTSATLSWTSSNATSCYASGSWSGTKSISGSESTGNLTSSKTYTITCTGSGGSVSDSVTVNVEANRPPDANAGPDKEVYEDENIILEGSGSDPDGDSITYSWSCTNGSLSNSTIAQPTYYAPTISYDTTYTCTLTVRDPHGLSDSDTMNVLVREKQTKTLSVSLSTNPASGCAPLNDVDLSTYVSGSATGLTTYFFDCTNDGSWERIISNSASSYNVYDLCNYYSPGTYYARVRAEREGISAEDTTSVYVNSCYTSPTVDIKANSSDGSITIPYNTSATLSWTSSNATSCYASGSWSGTKSISGTESTGNLTSSKTYTITCTGSGGSVSDSVTVNLTSTTNLSFVKLVSNLSRGTSYFDQVYAIPGESLSFSIQITAANSYLQNLIVRDTLPDKIIYQGNLRVDGVPNSGNIFSGLNIGDLAAGQTKNITFEAYLAGFSQFNYGNTTLINTASIQNSSISLSDTATIVVTKAAVAGAATSVSTGLTNNIFLDSFFLPLVITVLIIWIFKSNILKFEEWIDKRKKEYYEYKAHKTLQLKIAKIKAKEFFRSKV
jgi:hypothetical protein